MDSLTLINSLLDFSSAPWLLGDSGLTALLSKMSAFGRVALGLGFVIFIHELGHFLAAKTFGVRCDKFYVGFDVPIRLGPIRLPRTLGKFQWGETEYGIGIIPLGGYVKMLGQDDDPRKAKEEADKVRAGGDEAQPLDPRSYPAKPVWQRMIIISAGVVMNLVSAVFLAAAAYFFGVPYTPAIVGNAAPGGPAWMADMQPGDHVLRVGADGDEDPNMRFADMLGNIVINGINAEGKPIEVLLDHNGERKTIQATPSGRYRPDERPILGFSIERSNAIGPEVTLPFSQLDGNALGLLPGDHIVSVDGEKLPTDARFDIVMSEELRKRMAAKWNQSVTLGIERHANPDKGSEAKSFDITVPPVHRKTLGVGFEMEAVTALRPNSVGEQAGFKVGDKIVAVDGEKLLDAFDLPTMFAARAGGDVKFTVQRGEEQVELSMRSPSPPVFDAQGVSGSAELSLGGVGLAFGVSPVISSIEKEMIKDANIQIGDRLEQVRWNPSDAQQKAAEKVVGKSGLQTLMKTLKLDSYHNAAYLMASLQNLPSGSSFDLDLTREGKTISTQLALESDPDQYLTDERGLFLAGITLIHQTNDIGAALKMGLWETKKRFLDVLGTLKMLFTGKVGVDDFAGPLMLFSIATEEASHSTSRLLLFLTLLSANLAIINFLPIPALDGGHMMFLTAEAVRGKPVNEEWQIRLTMMGVLGLLGLMAFVILNDLFTLL